MARLTSTPGCGSASRAGPIGISGDAAMATATAMTPPARVTTARRARDSATRLPRVAPIARSTGNSAESRASCRLSSWPMTASAIRPASAANAASAIACGRMACWVAVTWSAWLIGQDLAVGVLVPLRQRGRGPREAGDGRARPQPHVRRVAVAHRRDRAGHGERADQRRRLAVAAAAAAADRHDLRVDDDDRGDAEGHRDALGEVGQSFIGLFGTPSSRNVPPGPTCSRAASWGSIIAWPGASGSNGRPARTFTLSAETPTA